MSTEYLFGDPHFLWLLLLVPLLSLFYGKVGRAAAVKFSSTAVAAGQSRKRKSSAGALLFFLRLIALSLLVIALARPQIGKGQQSVEASGIDIVLAVDVSLSMLGLDFEIDGQRDTRLEAVKVVIADFIERRPHDRLALVAFAGEPYLVSPLTLNHDWLLQNLERLRVGLVRETGTAIGSAIGMSVNRLRDLEDAQSRVVILLTDGKNTAGQISPVAAAEAAAAFETRIYTIAAGSEDRVLVPRTGRNYEIFRDKSGEPIAQGYAEFPVDEDALREVSTLTDGKFYRARDTESLKKIYAEIDRLEKTVVELQQFSQFEELFFWPLGLGLAFLLLEQLLAHTMLRRLP